MKKFLFMGIAALAFVSCNKDMIESSMAPAGYQNDATIANYANAFKATFGVPDPNQTWGFGNPVNPVNAMRRSMASPAVPSISAPFTAETLAAAMANAKEVNATNATENWSGSPNFAVEMKITGTWNGGISVAASEDWGSGDTPETGRAHRNIYVTGTWNITNGQRIGGKGMIVIGNGGTVNVESGTLEMVNQARLVVLAGGKLTGAGTVVVNNGNGAGYENYNGGLIDIASFNNNFGKFYNYGDFKVTEYKATSKESNFYNHHIVSITDGTNGANARIYNTCQWYCSGNLRIRNYEGVMGSSLIVGGELMFSGSEDGTSDPTYVGLAAGALVKCNTLYNNGTSWTGPTSGGYAVLDVEDKITYLNWEQDHPENGGNFENNIYAYAGTWTNVPAGNGYQQTDPSDATNHALSIASYKFNYISNLTGNGNVKMVEKGNYEVIPASDDFVLGTDGCTPGFSIKNDGDQPSDLPSLHVMAEDLSVSDASDFDFNDCVIDVFYVDANTVTIKLLAAGGTLPLRINEDDNWEVHKLFDVDVTCMVNTGTKYHTAHAPYSQVDGKAAVELTLTGKTWSSDQNTFAAQVRDQIKLEVYKNNQWTELKADQGEPAAKIATSVNIYMKDNDWYPEEYRWPWEKQNIGELFRQYVQNPSMQWYITK